MRGTGATPVINHSPVAALMQVPGWSHKALARAKTSGECLSC